MTRPAPPSAGAGGGFLIAAGTIVGAIVGVLAAQPTLGVLGGFAIGAAVAIALWLRERAR